MAQVTGRITITVGSLGVVRSQPGSTLDFGGVKRSPINDDQGLAGYMESSVEGSIQASFTHKAGISLQALAQITNEDITFEADSGSVWVLRNAFTAEPPKISKGEIQVTFNGTCQEVKA